MVASFNYLLYNKKEASRGAAARRVTVKPRGCGFDIDIEVADDNKFKRLCLSLHLNNKK